MGVDHSSVFTREASYIAYWKDYNTSAQRQGKIVISGEGRGSVFTKERYYTSAQEKEE